MNGASCATVISCDGERDGDRDREGWLSRVFFFFFFSRNSSMATMAIRPTDVERVIFRLHCLPKISRNEERSLQCLVPVALPVGNELEEEFGRWTCEALQMCVVLKLIIFK